MFGLHDFYFECVWNKSNESIWQNDLTANLAVGQYWIYELGACVKRRVKKKEESMVIGVCLCVYEICANAVVCVLFSSLSLIIPVSFALSSITVLWNNTSSDVLGHLYAVFKRVCVHFGIVFADGILVNVSLWRVTQQKHTQCVERYWSGWLIHSIKYIITYCVLYLQIECVHLSVVWYSVWNNVRLVCFIHAR